MLTIQQAGTHVMLCTDPHTPDRGEMDVDGERLIYYTIGVVTTEAQLAAVLALYPNTSPEKANYYRICAGLPLQ
jgi:hypothetical protein